MFCGISSVYAEGTTVGFSMGSSVMEMPPVKDVTDNEQTFDKTSMIFFARNSIKDGSLILTAKTEVMQITRRGYSVLETTIPQVENQGIRALEMDAMWYYARMRGWRTYTKFGYNTKGYEKNDNIQFALARGEVYAGLAFVANRVKVYSKLQKQLRDIDNGMRGVTDEDYFESIDVFRAFGQGYFSNNLIITRIAPFNSRISYKLLGKIVSYRFDLDTPRRFSNEAKVMAGLMFKTPYNHMLEFSIFYDDVIKEKGVSLGYYYYFANRANAISEKFDAIHDYYRPKKAKWKPRTQYITEDDLQQRLQTILEDMGY